MHPASPCRPRLSLRIGVTGHRAERILVLAERAGHELAAYEGRLANMLESVLDAVGGGCAAIKSEPDSLFSPDQPILRVISGAAFGVDRIAATVVDERLRVAPGAAWRLEIVLPAPLTLTAEAAWPDFVAAGPPDASTEAYAEDWRRALDRGDSVTELPASWRLNGDAPYPEPPAIEHLPPFKAVERLGPEYRLSYVEAADFQLRQIDMLIAVWDGEPSRGPGGVADIAAEARGLGMPVVLINAVRPELPPTMLRAVEFGPEKPNIIGWSPRALEAVIEPADCRDAAIADAVRSILQLPGRDAKDGHAAGHRAPPLGIDDLFAESGGALVRTSVYHRFVAVLGGRLRTSPAPGVQSRPRHSRSDEGWKAMVEAVHDQRGLGHDIDAILRKRYLAVSTLANAYAARYRSAFISAFLLGAIAGGLAVFGQAFPVTVPEKAVLTVVELVVILMIFHIVRRGKHRKYHAKYIQYRTLAEALHSLRFMTTVGEASGLLGADAGLDTWHGWYARATVRELGLPNTTLDAAYQRRIIKAAKHCEIDPQIAYHEHNALIMMKVDHNIHRIGNALFFGVILALLTLLALSLYKMIDPEGADSIVHALKPWMSVVAAFFPALGSALAGIRFMADFDGKAMRSIQMTEVLRALSIRADEALEKQDFHETRAILRDLAATLAEDVSLFRAMYSRRELVLPS